MAIEIERKYLVFKEKLPKLTHGRHFIQGYLFNDKEKSMRIRVAGQVAFLTVKSGTNTLSRQEFEYQIPLADAQAMLELCGSRLIDKHRYIIEHQGNKWEVDVFHGENEGLILAEIELEQTDQQFTIPHWIDCEVTDEPRYLNALLVDHPFSRWKR